MSTTSTACVWLLLVLILLRIGDIDAHNVAAPSASSVEEETRAVQKSEPNMFNPSDSSHFSPGASVTFASVGQAKLFNLDYADGTIMTAYAARDVVQLGEFYVKARFACSVLTNNPTMNGVDGILGFGLPAATIPELPHPLLFEISDDGRADPANNNLLPKRIFSFLSNEKSAELQMGGYDPAAIEGPLIIEPSTSTAEYAVRVTSFKLGQQELLHFTPLYDSVPAVLDSGTACLVLPDVVGDRFQSSPWRQFQTLEQNRESIFFTVGIHEFEIPYSVWATDGKPCVRSAPKGSGFSGLIFGDVVFRHLIVVFDLSKPSKPMIGMAKQNPHYKPVDIKSKTGSGVHKFPVVRAYDKKDIIKRAQEDRDSEHAQLLNGGRQLDRIPVYNMRDIQYFLEVSAGTPRQKFTVLFDTGSSMLALFSLPPPANELRNSVDRMGASFLQTEVEVYPDSRYGSSHHIMAIASLAFCATALMAAVFVRRRRGGGLVRSQVSLYGTGATSVL